MTGLMNGAVRLVVVQFSFSNLGLIPNCLKRIGEESPSEFTGRKSEIRGEMFLQPVSNVGCALFLSDLASTGYILVDAFSRVRTKDGHAYAMVRFVFSDVEHDTSSSEFKAARPAAEDALRQLVAQATWRARAFLNPFFKKGEVVDGLYAVSINLEAREPLIDNDGEPLVRWQKDEDGNRIGDSPVRVEPRLFLRIHEGEIVVK